MGAALSRHLFLPSRAKRRIDRNRRRSEYRIPTYHIFEHWISRSYTSVTTLETTMTALMAMSLSLLMIGTAFLSGIFGMAGGLILIGVLLVVFPLPTAMVLHAVTQMASNGWRAALWFRHIVWKSMAFYVAGCPVSVGLWSITLYVPDKAIALLLLGLSPFLIRAVPDKVLPRSFGPLQ